LTHFIGFYGLALRILFECLDEMKDQVRVRRASEASLHISLLFTLFYHLDIFLDFFSPLLSFFICCHHICKDIPFRFEYRLFLKFYCLFLKFLSSISQGPVVCSSKWSLAIFLQFSRPYLKNKPTKPTKQKSPAPPSPGKES
jgi:hypothetical protein